MKNHTVFDASVNICKDLSVKNNRYKINDVKIQIKNSAMIRTIAIAFGVVEVIVGTLLLLVLVMCYRNSTIMLKMLLVDIAEQKERDFNMDLIGNANGETINQLRFENATTLAKSTILEVHLGNFLCAIIIFLIVNILFILGIVYRSVGLLMMYFLWTTAFITIGVFQVFFLIITPQRHLFIVGINFAFSFSIIILILCITTMSVAYVYIKVLVKEMRYRCHVDTIRPKPLRVKKAPIGNANGYTHTLHDATPNYVV